MYIVVCTTIVMQIFHLSIKTYGTEFMPPGILLLRLLRLSRRPAYCCSGRPLPLFPRSQRHVTLACRLRSGLGSAGARDVPSAANMTRTAGRFPFQINCTVYAPCCFYSISEIPKFLTSITITRTTGQSSYSVNAITRLCDFSSAPCYFGYL